MQYQANTPPHAQHVPAGWTFPTLAVNAPSPAMPGPVMGGGATGTVTRVRWGRLLPVFAGVALVAFGLWSMSQAGSTSTPSGTVSGGGSGSSEIDVARAARTPQVNDATADDAASQITTPDAAPTAPATTPAAVPAPAARAATPTTSRATPVRRGTGRAVRRGGAAAVAVTRAAPAAGAAATAPRTASGGGGPTGELPLTGIETWIAAFLGFLLLGVGICVHVNAVRIAATALLYRRGILLRPVDCARMAQERGLPQAARVALSNLLHRLLEEPAQGDFVGTRMAL